MILTLPSRPRRPAVTLVTLIAAATLLAGCSGGDDSAGFASADGPDVGVTVSDDTESAPEIDLPGGEPPDDLVVDVVVAGDGPEVQAGDLLLADYTGVLWDDGEQFDASWDRGEPAAFGIGVGQVIDGWDTGLVGQSVGSRVLLVIPPELGYGEEGTPSGIPGGATLVFVVDIRDAFGAGSEPGGTPVDDLPDGLPAVTGEPGQEPTVDLSDASEPTESATTVVVQGEGDPLSGELLAVHAVQADYGTGEITASTWGSAPTSVSPDGLPGLAEALDGAAAGTRTVTVIPAEENEGQAIVLVLDVLGSY